MLTLPYLSPLSANTKRMARRLPEQENLESMLRAEAGVTEPPWRAMRARACTSSDIKSKNPLRTFTQQCTMLHMSKRIAVIFTDEEYAEVKRMAGLVPLSAYFRNLAINKAVNDRVDDIAEAARGGRPLNPNWKMPKPTGGKCLHHKQRGELCYKCDPKFGNPVLA